MEPITTFLMSTVAGSIIMNLVGNSVNELTVKKVSDFWNDLNIGNHDLQNAFSEAYTHTLASIELVLTPREGLKGMLQKILPGSKREKELAGDFSENVLKPYLHKKGLTGKNDFLIAGKKACQHLQKQKDVILNFQELLPELKQDIDNSSTSTGMNENARETFCLIESVLFVGHDLSQAPKIEKTRDAASNVIFKRLKSAGGDIIKNYFNNLNMDDELFYGFLQEDSIFLKGLVFNLDLLIKSNQKVANILQHYRSQEEKKDHEKEKREKISERDELLEKLTKVEQGIDLMKQAGVDITPMEGQLKELQNQVIKIDTLLKRTDEWLEFQKDLQIQMTSFKSSFGDISEILEELGGKFDILLSEVRKMDETLGEVDIVTKETKETVITVDKKVDFIIDLLNGFKRDSLLSDNQRESLIAGIDPKADFDLNYLYDFTETREYELGRGAVGVVYRAVHKGTKESCALKLLKIDYKENHSVVSRFLREGSILKGMKHKNIVKVEEVGGGGKNLNFYIQMELLKGSSLRKLIDEKNLPKEWDKLLYLTNQLLEGVRFIHKHGIIHRDINPNNIFLTNEGIIKIMDFGVAKIVGLSGLTRHGEIVGTSRYMSPEQERGESLDYRTDIYSLGLVLYELYTGRLPEKPLKSVRNYNPSIPEWVDIILQNCLALEKEKRHPSVEKLHMAFEGEGADPQDIRKYKNQLYVIFEDGKITGREEAILSELRSELNIPEKICKELA